MTDELKTLKDINSPNNIEDIWFSIGIGRTTKRDSISHKDVRQTCDAFSKDLRKEAIKRALYWKERRDQCLGVIKNEFHGRYLEAMEFANLTEEELEDE